MRCLRPADLLLVRAGLHAGAQPAQALAAVADPARRPGGGTDAGAASPLEGVLGALQAGDTLVEVARRTDGEVGPLVRALAIAEATGTAAAASLDTLLDGVMARDRLARLVEVRSADARLTGRVLLALPLAGLAMSLLLSPGARGFLTSAAGLVVLTLAGSMIALATAWTRWLVGGVLRAAQRADPLAAAAFAYGRTSRGGRRRGARRLGDRQAGDGLTSPTAESVDLLAAALSAGLPLQEAAALVGRLGPPVARATWVDVAAALRTGAAPSEALPGSLAEVAALLEVTRRWGAPAAPALRLLSRDLQARAEAAAEAAAERLAASLVFPTTLLLVPAFGLLVVSPLVAAAFRSTSLGL